MQTTIYEFLFGSTLCRHLFRRRFDLKSLMKEGETFIVDPPLSPGVREAMLGVAHRSGVTLLDVWRKSFIEGLNEIGEQQTWKLQRAKTIEIILREEDWRSLEVAIRDIVSLSAWEHVAEGVSMFSGVPEDQWKDIVFQRYLIALINGACLKTICMRCFGLDDQEELEIRVYAETNRNAMRQIFELNEQVEKITSKELGHDAEQNLLLRDQVVKKILDAEKKNLSSLRDAVIYKSGDLDRICQQLSDFQELKARINSECLTYGDIGKLIEITNRGLKEIEARGDPPEL